MYVITYLKFPDGLPDDGCDWQMSSISPRKGELTMCAKCGKTFGTVDPRARRRTGSAISCSVERRNEELRIFISGIDFLARGGFVGLVIGMKKGPDDAAVLINEALSLANLGNPGAALGKFRPILAALWKKGDGVDAVGVHLNIIACHAALQEVSRRSS